MVPPAGHAKPECQFGADPDHVGELKARHCAGYAADLQGQAGTLVDVNQITEVPPVQLGVNPPEVCHCFGVAAPSAPATPKQSPDLRMRLLCFVPRNRAAAILARNEN